MAQVMCKARLFLGLMLALAACNSIEPIYNVEGDTIPIDVQQKFSADQIGKIITTTALGRGWTVDEERPGVLHIGLKWHDHSMKAGIDTAVSCLDDCTPPASFVASAYITYSHETYSIQIDRPQTSNLSEGMTYRRYNKYIEKLQHEIDLRLSRAALS
jgi:hypothetical protein